MNTVGPFFGGLAHVAEYETAGEPVILRDRSSAAPSREISR
jgi:hypothetical protein